MLNRAPAGGLETAGGVETAVTGAHDPPAARGSLTTQDKRWADHGGAVLAMHNRSGLGSPLAPARERHLERAYRR